MEPVNFSTSKFCKERKQEREGKKEPRAGKRGVWSRAGERDLSFGIFQELVPISLGSGQRQPAAASSLGRVRRGARRAAGWPGVEKPAREAAAAAGDRALRASSAQETCARAPSLTPASPFSPLHPAPTPALSRAHPATRAHSLTLPLAHTHGRLAAKFRLRSFLRDPAAVLGAVTLNFPSPVTFSSLSLLLSLLRPSPRLFLKSILPPTITPIQPTPNLFAPHSPQQQLQNRKHPQT